MPFPESKYSKALLFTDGFSTLSNDIPRIIPSYPVYSFISSPVNNFKNLDFFSAKTGGQCFKLKSNQDEIVNALNVEKFGYLNTVYKEGEVVDVLPTNPVPGTSVTVVGKLMAEIAEITINYGYDLNRIVYSKKIVLKKSDSIGFSEIVPRLWASKKIDELSLIDTGKKNVSRVEKKKLTNSH